MNERNLASSVVAEVKKAIVGKDPILVKVLAAILARGHILHHKGLGHRPADTVNGDLIFLHGFQQGGLGAAGSPVQLIGQKEVAHNRPGLKDPILVKVLAAILARGHILLEDIPGVGKTTLALAFAKALDLQFSRVQFTPDVMPSDVLEGASHVLIIFPNAVLPFFTNRGWIPVSAHGF